MSQSATHLRNPLDAFTSYSTHFVLMAARTTENARAFSDPAANQQTLDAIERTKQLGDRIPYNTGTTSGDVFLVMDTRRFSQFTVDSMKYEVFVNGLSKGHSHSNLATTIEMTILDSVGISFINFLQWLMDTQLQTNFDGMIFMIRAIFVGHNEDGSSQTVQSITIPAHLFKMEVNLDFAKGIYTMEFMPNMNFSVYQHNRWTHIGTASTYSSLNSSKLGGMVLGLEEALNKEAQDVFDKGQKLLQAGKAPRVNTNGAQKFGRRIQYQITLPEKWAELDFVGSWKHNVNSNAERNYRAELQKLDAAKTPAPEQTRTGESTSTTAKSVSMSTPVGITVTEVLDIMFRQVPGIADFANAEVVSNPNGVAKFYKHVVSLTSSDELVIVHIDVVAFEVPNAQPPSTQARASERGGAGASDAWEQIELRKAGVVREQNSPYQIITEGGVTKRIPKSYFELDFIFTGKNTQVLNFDMKMQNLVFLLAANVKVSEGEMFFQRVAGQEGKPNDRTLSPELMSLRPYDPLLIPLKTELEKTNGKDTSALSRNPEAQKNANASLQEYSRNLSAFYALSPIQTAVTIKGNPDIMLKFSSPSMPEHRSIITLGGGGELSRANESERAAYRKNFEQKVLKFGKGEISQTSSGVFTLNRHLGSDSYMTGPVFVKVNIKGPNVDPRTNELLAGQDFATEVLLDNYYVVFKVVNKIERGVFTQDLELWSHNVFGSTKLAGDLERRPGAIAQ